MALSARMALPSCPSGRITDTARPVFRSSLRSQNPQRIVCSAAQPPRSLAGTVKAAGAAVLLSGALLSAQPAGAVLNKYEEAAGGEFGTGTALQFGSADEIGVKFDGQDLRRSNFTAANLRQASFKNAKLEGAYLIKAVAYQANFEGADLSDTLFDRAVLNEANLTNAIFQRSVLTRSDLTDAIIEGADFTNSLIDKSQQQKLCRYASGTNPVTGVSTRDSLGCGSRRKYRESTPSNYDGPQPTDEEKKFFRESMPTYGRAGIVN